MLVFSLLIVPRRLIDLVRLNSRENRMKEFRGKVAVITVGKRSMASDLIAGEILLYCR